MNIKFVFAMISVLATLSMVGTTVLLSQSVDADKGGRPNDNALAGPASENAADDCFPVSATPWGKDIS